MKIEIAPSILAADFGKLNQEIAELEPYVDRIHADVMDGHFVPNISFGAPVLRCLKTGLPMDAHLMIEEPQKYFDDFVEALRVVAEAGGTELGDHTIIIHSEASGDLRRVLEELKKSGVKVGVSIKPKTGVGDVKDVLDVLDQVLVMTVEPGFGGQEFMEEMVGKIREFREMGFEGDIAVDGGINAETGAICRGAGANVLIAGSYIFGAENRKEAVIGLRG